MCGQDSKILFDIKWTPLMIIYFQISGEGHYKPWCPYGGLQNVLFTKLLIQNEDFITLIWKYSAEYLNVTQISIMSRDITGYLTECASSVWVWCAFVVFIFDGLGYFEDGVITALPCLPRNLRGLGYFEDGFIISLLANTKKSQKTWTFCGWFYNNSSCLARNSLQKWTLIIWGWIL